MKKQCSTKKALLASFLALCMCFTMLVGTTFAWFTDSVSSSGNKIVSGTLDIDLVDANGDSLAGEMIEWATLDGRAQDEIFWEPGCTYETEEFYIVNNGNLNLKFKFDVTGIDGDAKLLEVVDFTCMADASWFNFNTGAVSVSTSGEFDLLEGYSVDTFFYGVQEFDEYVLEPGDKVGPIVLSGHMAESAGNEYQGLTIEGIAVSLIATQATGEEDSFSGTYDEGATFGYYAKGSAPVVNGKVQDSDYTSDDSFEPVDGANYVKMVDQSTGGMAGSILIPDDAIAEGASSVEVVYMETSTYESANIIVNDGYNAKTFDISVSGIDVNYDGELKYKVQINIGTGYSDLTLYHYDEPITVYNYNSVTGVLTFETDSFSPFTATYNPESNEIVTPDVGDMPQAIVTKPETDADGKAYSEYTYADYAWGHVDVAEGQTLSTVYKFVAPHTSDNIDECAYKDYECDYVVKIDKDIDAKTIFLGGNYGSWGWIGFENPEAVTAGDEIYLLGSVTKNAWTYGDVVAFVGEFLCGVAPSVNATPEQLAELEGATFTVMLRLTNPTDGKYVDVNIVNYTFSGLVDAE